MTIFIRNILASITIIISFSCNENNVKTIDYGTRYPMPKIEFNPRHYVCYKTDEKLVIDGNLAENSWQESVWTENFIDIKGIKQPLFQTRLKMLWDDEYLYIGAELNEPHINARLKQRDAVIFYDNDFEVFIDPNADTHNYFEFEMNALNTVWDLLMVKPYKHGGPPVTGWNIAGLKSAVKIYGTINKPSDFDEKWTLEIGFPIKAFINPKRNKLRNNEVWRINFSRVEWQYEVVDGKYKKKINPKTKKAFPEYNWVWSPQGVVNMHYPEMWGFLMFSDKKPGEEGVKFTLSSEEKHKWDLRKIYYYQQIYYHNFNKYANKLSLLEEIGLDINLEKSSITFEVSKSMFKICAAYEDGILHINEQGKAWKTPHSVD